MPRVVKVAVIGSGLAGLTAAYLLNLPTVGNDEEVSFEVHLFEKSSNIGMDAASISLSLPDLDEDWRVDVPMRSFQGGYYKHLIALYRKLGVRFRASNFSYSFSTLSSGGNMEERGIHTTMIYNGSSGKAGISRPAQFFSPEVPSGPGPGANKAPSLAMGFSDTGHRLYSFLSRASSSFVWICFILQTLLFYLLTLFDSIPMRRRRTGLDGLAFKEWVDMRRPSGTLGRLLGLDVGWTTFAETILVPLFSAVCTAPREDVLQHPMEEFFDYIWLTLGTNHYVVNKGVRHVVTRLTKKLEHAHLSTTITSIRPEDNDPTRATIVCNDPTGQHEYPGFDHIIFAAQANRVVPILEAYLSNLPPSSKMSSLTQRRIHCLAAFEYRQTIIVNHTDDSLLPDYDEDVRDLNLVSSDDWVDALLNPDFGGQEKMEAAGCLPETYTMATQILPRPIGYPDDQPMVFQTTNPIVPIRQDCILSSATMERAIVTVESKKALKGLTVTAEPRMWQARCTVDTHLGPLQGYGENRRQEGPGIWFCGSYAHEGIPLLEGCVVSARNVIEQGILKSEGSSWITEPWTTERTFGFGLF